MKKYLPYLLILFLLSGAVAWFVFFRDHNTSGDGDFAYKKREEISKITLANQLKQEVVLERKNGGWIINGKYPVRQELISQLLEAITRVTSLAPVPANGHDHVMAALLQERIAVTVYGKEQQPVKKYLVGGPTVDSRGTYMLLELEDGKMAPRPHIVYIPGYDGFLTPIYANLDEEMWRSRQVFAFSGNEAERVKLDYGYEPERSFEITRAGADSFVLNPLQEQFRLTKPNEQRYMKQYLSFYENISMEAFENANSIKDSIIRTKPYCVFQTTLKGGKKQEVKLFYMPRNKRTKTEFDARGKAINYDADRYFALIDGKDFAVVQYYVFGKLLHSYSDFFYQPEIKPQLGEDAEKK